MGGITREVENADRFVADQASCGGVAHVAVGDEPGGFSNIHHHKVPYFFRIWRLAHAETAPLGTLYMLDNLFDSRQKLSLVCRERPPEGPYFG